MRGFILERQMALYLSEDDLDEIDAWTLSLVADCRADIRLAQEARRCIAHIIKAAAEDNGQLISYVRADREKRQV